MSTLPLSELLHTLPLPPGDPLAHQEEDIVDLDAARAARPARLVVGPDAPSTTLPAMPHLQEEPAPPPREEDWVAPAGTPTPAPLVLTPTIAQRRE